MILGKLRQKLCQRERYPAVAASPRNACHRVVLEVVNMRHYLLIRHIEQLLEAEELVCRVIGVLDIAGELVIAGEERNAHVEVVRPQRLVMEVMHKLLAEECAVRQS